MENMVSNLINGNLADARKQARRHRQSTIKDWLEYHAGWSTEKAFRAARFLKTGEGWQAYCDAK